MTDKIELLSPAGDVHCFKAAIAAKTDAIYFGVGSLNARVRAKNITLNELSYLVALAKQNNVKTYLTLNILLTDDEFSKAIDLVREAEKSGVDAIIVQDLGLLYILKTIFPEMELHGSTQLTTHNLAQCEFLSEFGVSQLNLSRELSIEEMKDINKFLSSKNIISEVFIHGAFCISYSGQCYFSKALYNHSGNRGECVQPCRRCYKTENFVGTPFNLKDNNLYPCIKDLVNSGCGSLKIEGRIKSSNYVYSVVKAYRNQLDKLKQNLPLEKKSTLLENSMNRNFTAGYAQGKISTEMFHFGKKDESVELIGVVKKYNANEKTLLINLEKKIDVNKNDKIIITEKSDDFVCTGIVLNVQNQNELKIEITNKLVKKIFSGQKVYRDLVGVSEDYLQKEIDKVVFAFEKYQSKIAEEKKEKISMEVFYCENNNKLKCICTKLKDKKLVTIYSDKTLSIAENKGLNKETVFEKLTQLGETSFVVDSFKFDTNLEKYFLPLSELKSIRRKAVESLKELDLKSTNLKTISLEKNNLDKLNELHNNSIQFNDAKIIEIKVCEIPNYIDKQIFETLANKIKDENLVPYFPAIIFEKHIKSQLEFLSVLPKQKIICDNSGFALLASKLGFEIILGQRLNITNSFSVFAYKSKLNLCGFVPSYELSKNDLEKLFIPENVCVYKLKNYAFPLFQSRQCLVKNLSNCKKEICDDECLKNCNKKIKFVGQQGEKLLALKKSGFYSAIYLDEEK